MPVSSYVVLRNRFEDFDEFATAVRAWDLDFRQLDRGKSTPEFAQVIGSDVLFSYARFNRHYHQQGGTPPGMRTFALLEDTVSGVHWFGREVTPSSLMCFPGSRELESVSRPNFEVYTISFSEALLNQSAAAMGLPDLSIVMYNEERVANCDPVLIQQLRNQLRKIRSFAQRNTLHVSNPELSHALEGDLPALVLTALSNSLDINKSKPAQWKKQQALKKAHEYISELPNDPISVNALCEYTNVSLRTLESAFKEYYGVTPKNYLKATRLNGVYKELKQCDPQFSSITDIANKWGFWHMGQFAADYKRLFGELPSGTLKKI